MHEIITVSFWDTKVSVSGQIHLNRGVSVVKADNGRLNIIHEKFQLIVNESLFHQWECKVHMGARVFDGYYYPEGRILRWEKITRL